MRCVYKTGIHGKDGQPIVLEILREGTSLKLRKYTKENDEDILDFKNVSELLEFSKSLTRIAVGVQFENEGAPEGYYVLEDDEEDDYNEWFMNQI